MTEPNMASEDPATIQPSVFTCKSDWHAESALECGRCTAIICPGCMVHTPGGTRCKPCANFRRPPMYDLQASHYLKAAGVSLALALPMGFVGAIFLPPGGIGFFGILIGFFIGSGIGSIFAQSITRVTRGKRGIGMQSVAVGGVLVLLFTRFALDGFPFELLRFDLIGPIAGFMAASVAWQRLR